MKLRKLHIEDYKMFKNFDISFLDENDKALSIIVLAGVNGSGKTTLLEFIVKYFKYKKNELMGKITGKSYGLGVGYSFGAFIETTLIDEPSSIVDIGLKNTESDHIIYFSSGTDSVDNIKESILEHYRRLLRKYSHLKALEEIQRFLDSVFTNDMAITFTIEDIDIVLRDNEKVVFKNSRGDTFDIDKLSTGEKTLLSKVLKLYFKNYKNKVILIDEPELSLHPSWQNRVLKIYENFAKKNGCQIIIATHSPHIIGSAKNEYLRILRKNDEGVVEAISGLNAEGRDINSILFDVMGEVAYRPKEFDEKIDRLFYEIDERNLEEAKELLMELKKSYGKNDTTVMEATMLIEMFDKES